MSRKFSADSCRLPLMGSVFAFALVVTDVHALGLGGLRVQSALNQPFVGEITLLDVKSSELDTVKAQIASAEEFAKAGSERYHYLSGLRFTPQVSPRGETVIRVSSREPIREPYMDFLMEVTWPKGRLVKGYTVLLDPPVTDGRRASRVEPPVAKPRTSSNRAHADSGATVPTRPSRKTQPAAPPSEALPASSPTALVGSGAGFPKYIGPIPRGAGLWRLSTSHAPTGATAAQTAMALYRNNQDAFINGDINRLRVGKTLVIPNAAELFALGPEAADREFAAALRGQTVRRTPIADTSLPGPEPETEPRLKIAGTAPEGLVPGVRGAAGPKPPDAVQQELLLVRETSESTRQETAELRERIRELEAQLGEIQQLLRLRTAELARIQGAPEVAAEAQSALAEPSDAANAAADTNPVEEGSLIETPASPAPGLGQGVGQSEDRALEQALADSGGAVSREVLEPAVLGEPIETLDLPIPDGSPGAPLEGIVSPVTGATPDGGVPGEQASPGGQAQEPLATAAPPPLEPLPADAGVSAPRTAETESEPLPVQPTERSGSGLPLPWGDLLVPLASAAGVILLGIAALAWVRVRRRDSVELDLGSESFELTAKSAGVSPPQTGGPAGPGAIDKGRRDSGAPEVVAGDTPSIFSALGRSHPESDEADVLSEADIYIAYGRYREAEELLREEIQRAPERIDLKYKLAESYHGAKNFLALDRLMNEMQGAGEDRLYPERWQRLVDFAKGIEGVEHPTGGTARSVPLASSAVPASGESLLGETPSLDIGDVQGPSGAGGLAGGQVDGFVSATNPSRRDVPVLRSSRPTPTIPDDLEPMSLDLDDMPQSLDLAAQPEPMGLDLHLDQEEGELFGAVSDLELTIEDLRAASDLDLESFVDSTPTVANLGEESSSRRERSAAIGPLANHPPKLRAVSSALEGVGDDTGVGGLDEVGSSDLLSSQWQMDSGLWDENATKLDLARAYVEMGDSDSAKGILEEVVDEGNEEQRGEAAQMLRALG